ncbi:MAG: long-chain-fatty-acid--CoA ligase [Pseudomonadota bacterium]|jgi:fatty-acyl-CoA synthase|nr:long-chain-fatty-acid--CoA ligase [Pseudomonadota bacterium]
MIRHGLMQPYPLNVAMLCRRVESQFPEKTVTTRRQGRDTTITCRRLMQRARQLADALRRAGVRPGDCVSTLMWNSQEHLEAYFAVPGIGAVLHTVNARLPADTIGALLDDTRPVAMLADASLLSTLRQVRLPSSLKLIVRVADGDPGNDERAAAIDYEGLLAGGSRAYEWPEIDEQAACGICHTSGTTGRSKGVVYSHRSTVLHAMSMLFADGIALSEHDVCLTVVPMFHAVGWGFPYACALAGASQALSWRQSDPQTLAALIEQTGATLATAVPTVWINLLEQLRSGEIDAARLRSLTRLPIGGATVSSDLIDGYAQFGIRVQHCWGMTEVSPLGLVSTRRSWLSDESWSQRRLTPGVPLPGCELRVMTPQGTAAPAGSGAAGELQIRGLWVADAYLDPSAEDGRGGGDRFDTDSDGRRWLKTGDIAQIDSDGYVRIVDRAKDLIKSGGEWISSLELESALVQHPGVREAAVVGVPDSVWQERPVAFVSLVEDRDEAQLDLAGYLASRLPRWQIPERFIVLQELPRNNTGKLDKARLRELTRGDGRHGG